MFSNHNCYNILVLHQMVCLKTIFVYKTTCSLNVNKSKIQIQKMYTLFQRPLPVLSNYRSPCWYESLNMTDPYPIKSHLYTRYFQQLPTIQLRYTRAFTLGTSIFTNRLKNDTFGWRLRCLPSFYLIGINRGGSTGLWTSLLSHPHISSSGIQKELHYWNEVRYGGRLYSGTR